MKFIKKYLKQIICLAVVALFAILFAFNPTIATVAEGVYATQTLANAFESINMPLKNTTIDASKKEEFKIPLISKLSSKTYYIRVIDPIGKTHDCKVASGSVTEDEYFKQSDNSVVVKSLNNGYYSVVYFCKDEGKYIYSYPYQVKVKSVSYDFDFVGKDGKKVLVPSSVKSGTPIVLPNAFVKIKDTDEYVMADGDNKLEVTPVIVKDGATIFDLSAQPAKDENSTEEVTKIAEGENAGRYQLTPNLGNDEFATYIVYYRYLGGSDIPTKKYTINVSNDEEFETPKTLEIDKKEMPKNVELGKKGIELPEISAHTEYDENVDYNITEIRIEKEDNKNIYQVLTNNNRTFDMTVDAFTFDNDEEQSYANMIKNNNNYKVIYKIESFYGLTAEKEFLITGVGDNTKPEVFMAYSYDLTDGVWDKTDDIPYLKADEGKTVTVAEDAVNTDYAVELKSNYGFGELVFPAIYAKDLVNNYSDFTFIRYFQSKTNTQEKYFIDNIKLDEDNKVVAVDKTEEGFNASDDANIGKFNKVVRFKFNNKTSVVDEKAYTLHYYVVVNNNSVSDKPQENNVYETGSSFYEFKILNRAAVGSAATADDGSTITAVSTPTIEIEGLSNESAIAQKSSLTLTVSSKDEYDKRLKNAMFYYQTGSGTLENDIKDALNSLIIKGIWDSVDGAGVTTPDFSSFKSNILDNSAFVSAMQTKGYTDFAAIETTNNKTFELSLDLTSTNPVNLVAVTINDNNNIAIATKKLLVNDTTESVAPTAAEPTAATEDESGNKLTELEGKEGNNKYALDLSEVKTYNQGDRIYLPTVKFTDNKDSSLEVSAKYYVLSKEKLAQLAKVDGETNGTIPTITYNDPARVKYVAGEEKSKSAVGGYITTAATGTYYVVYTAIDDAGNQTFLHYSFEVVDAQAPILTVTVKDVTDPSNPKPVTINKTKDDNGNETNKISVDINAVLNFEYKLMSSDGNDLTNDKDSNFDNFNIVGVTTDASPSSNGYSNFAYQFSTPDTYTLTFIATHKHNEVEHSKVRESNPFICDIEVTVPELTWSNDVEIQSQAEIGETIRLPYITAQHGNTGVPVNVELSIKDPDNKTPEYGDAKLVTENGTDYWEFKFNDNKTEDVNYTTRGTYRITYTATSQYGSATPKVFDIKVGDSIAPTFKLASDKTATLRQDIVYDGTHPIEYSIDLVRYSERKLVITASSNGKEIYSVDTGLEILDKNGANATAQPFLNWSNLTVELKTQDGNLTENTDTDLEKQYSINGVGKYTLVLTMTDNNNNTTVKNINFNVVSKSDAKNINENVTGIVLIVVSLVILAGVILFFTFAGKKGGKGGSKRVKNSAKNTKQEELKADDSTDAKTGEVE